eukprot:PhM_4_TR7217/c0_g1_i1/m.104181/K08220/FLVCR, SLC49A1_2; MFS transporter, FLVCR family, feline leukemia virus subgroup C receptor-related protein
MDDSDKAPLVPVSAFGADGRPVAEPMRFVACLTFCLFSISNAMTTGFTATVFLQTERLFKTDTLGVNLLTSFWSMTFLLLAVPHVFVIQRFGLWGGQVYGSTMNTVGLVMKLLSAMLYPEMWLISLGSTVCGACASAMINLPPVVAEVWFPEKERAFCTAVCVIADNAGLALGMLLSPLIITDEDGASEDTLKKQFTIVLAIHTGTAVVALLLQTFVVKKRPDVPPSIAAAASQSQIVNDGALAELEPIPVAVKKTFASILTCCRMPNVPSVVFGVSCNIALGWVTGNTYAQIFAPVGVSGTTAGVAITANIVAGGTCALFVGGFISPRMHHAHRMVIVALFAATVSYAGLIATLQWVRSPSETSSPALFIALITGLFVITGMAQNTVTAVGLELLAEVSHPATPEVSSTLTYLTACTVFLPMNLALPSTLLTDAATKSDCLVVLGVFGALAFAATVSVAMCKVTLRRQHFEGGGGPATQ